MLIVKKGNDKGFTLIELLVAMTILSIVAVLILQGLRIGYKVWEKGESDITDFQRSRIGLGIVFKQLSSAYPFTRKDKFTDEKKLFFKGDFDSVEFVTTRPIGRSNRGGLFFVNYAIREDFNTGTNSLVAYQKPVLLMEDIDEYEISDGGDLMTLIPNVSNMRLDYTYEESEELDEEGFEDEDQKLPKEIRITIDLEEGGNSFSKEIVISVAMGTKKKKKEE